MDQRNLILAIGLSILIILGWQLYMAPIEAERARQAQQQQQQQQPGPPAPTTPGAPGAPAPGAPAPGAPQVGGAPAPSAVLDRPQALARSPRVAIATPQIEGSIALKGGRIDDVRLNKHRVTVDPNSGKVPVLSPEGTKDAYYAEFGWSSADPAVKVPGPDTIWTASTDRIAPDQTARLSWDNGEGITFRMDITIDADFLFTVKQSVENKSAKAVDLAPYGLVVRYGEPVTEGIYILHEGPYGVFDSRLKELGWSDLKGGKQQSQSTTGGWLGFSDKYWMATLIPDQKTKVDTTFRQSGTGAALRYQADFVAPVRRIAAGETAETGAQLYAGAKIVKTIDAYREKHGIDRFDLTIDWGWFWFFTKPLFWLLEKLFAYIGNFGLAIMALTVIVKAAFFPLANKSYVSMTRMKKLQPEFERLRERYGDDKVKMNQELMALYRREKVNPAAGCLPILLQIPVFFALYKVLYTTIEMRHQPFFGWIRDLSAPDPLTLLQGFGLIPWAVPGLLQTFDIGIWPILMGLTMYVQQMMNPQPADPIQARIFQWMPIIFTFMLAHFAVGLVIYWAWNNLLSMAQQYVIMRKLGVPISFGAKTPAPAAAPPAPAAPATPAKPAAPTKPAGESKKTAKAKRK
jgi:YidC/Oxa1 family membrane protein insertase